MLTDGIRLMSDAWWFVQVAALPLLAGWIAERLLDPGLHVRGLAVFCGLTGAYVGSRLWDLGGWELGPSLGGQALFPVLAGTLMVTGLFKMISLGAAGPRW
jgi:uncharacterized membrane protein YeaQ/YmgE (transglycosylase-associated protein family)